jgi:D-alanyl-D-alanine dipeptidase
MPHLAPLFRRPLLLLALGTAALPAFGAEPPGRRIAARAEEPLVEIRKVCPGITVELRYATARNITGKPIYPAGARALLRRSVAARLNRAQQIVRARGYALKVWDAYRPASAQRQLWNAVRDPAYVVEPSSTGSLHGWGAAVDVTLVDFRGREVRMPTDFDAFSTAARYDYEGGDSEIAANLAALKSAMAEAGFRHIRDEWWHYSIGNEPSFGPIDARLDLPHSPAAQVAKANPDLRAKPLRTSAPPKKIARTVRVLFPPRAA